MINCLSSVVLERCLFQYIPQRLNLHFVFSVTRLQETREKLKLEPVAVSFLSVRESKEKKNWDCLSYPATSPNFLHWSNVDIESHWSSFAYEHFFFQGKIGPLFLLRNSVTRGYTRDLTYRYFIYTIITPLFAIRIHPSKEKSPFQTDHTECIDLPTILRFSII